MDIFEFYTNDVKNYLKTGILLTILCIIKIPGYLQGMFSWAADCENDDHKNAIVNDLNLYEKDLHDCNRPSRKTYLYPIHRIQVYLLCIELTPPMLA